MSRLEVPFQYRTLWATGDLLLRAELNLLLKDASGKWRPETFLVDSGSEMTTMPAYWARKLGLPMPQQAAPGAVHTQTVALHPARLPARAGRGHGRDRIRLAVFLPWRSDRTRRPGGERATEAPGAFGRAG